MIYPEALTYETDSPLQLESKCELLGNASQFHEIEIEIF